MRHKVEQSKFAVVPVYRPRYTPNITLHSIFLLTLNCHLIHVFSMLSWILNSTSKTQDLILPCHLRPTLPSLRSRSNVQFSYKCLLTFLITVFTLWLTILLLCSGDIHPNPGQFLLHLLLTLLLLIIILTTLLDLLILVIIFHLSTTTYKVY